VSSIPADLRYTAEHEYLKSTADGNVVQIGITDYAQGELGDVVFVELPKVGDKFKAHDVFGTIEAVKAVSELYSPVAGEVWRSTRDSMANRRSSTAIPTGTAG
jgi:glycine cleavage system H protein